MIKDLLKEGFALKNKGHYKHALEVFYKALSQDNCSSELLLEIADIYFKMKNEERALNYLEQILEKNPKHIEALKLLEHIFINKNALAEAEQTAKNIYCISHNINDLAHIFSLLNRQGKFDEIFEYNFENPNEVIYLEQAKALYYKREFDQAEEMLKQALIIAPSNQDVILMLGQVYYAQNKKDLCIELLNQLMQDNENAELMNFYGLIEAYQGNYAKACKDILRAVKLAPKNDKYYYNLANLYFMQGDTAFAKRYYNLAIFLNPNNSNYHFALANLYYSEKQYRRALEELPDNLFEANLLKVIILYDTGYLALARKELLILLEQCPDNTILHEYNSRIDNDLGLHVK